MISNCENCDKMYTDYYSKYFTKNTCSECSDKFCMECKGKLEFDDKETKEIADMFFCEPTKKCGLYQSIFCYKCSSIDCDICEDTFDKCIHCYGSAIELCCGCLCCIECIKYKEDDDDCKIKYCKKHNYYVCEDCYKDKYSEHEFLKEDDIPINTTDFINNNIDKFMPRLTKYTLYMANN